MRPRKFVYIYYLICNCNSIHIFWASLYLCGWIICLSRMACISIFNILNRKYLFSSEIIQTCKQVMVTQARYVCVYASCAALRLNMTNSVHSRLTQEGYIEELSTCIYLDTACLKSSENVLSEK